MRTFTIETGTAKGSRTIEADIVRHFPDHVEFCIHDQGFPYGRLVASFATRTWTEVREETANV